MDYYTGATVKTKFIWLMMEKEMEDMVWPKAEQL